MVSPGMWNTTSERSTVMLSTYIFQSVGSLVVVSSGMESAICMSKKASSSRDPLSSTVCLSRSMPLLAMNKREKRPFTWAASTKSSVFRLVLVTSSSLIITLLSNSGHSCTSTIMRSTSAMVSAGCWLFFTRNSSIERSRGNDRLTCPTVMSIPVFSEAMAATLSTAQFCTGGR